VPQSALTVAIRRELAYPARVATGRQLVEYVWKNRPRVKVAKATADVQETENRIRHAARTSLWGSIRLVGTAPDDYLTPATMTLDAALVAATERGRELDAELDDPATPRRPTQDRGAAATSTKAAPPVGRQQARAVKASQSTAAKGRGAGRPRKGRSSGS